MPDPRDEERRRAWPPEAGPAIVRLARRRGALLLFGDEASFAQWGALSSTWAPIGQPPLTPTCGKRTAYKGFGLIDYFSGRLGYRRLTERFTAETDRAFLAAVRVATDHPLIRIQDGAKYQTAVATQEFIAAHADRLSGCQRPADSPDYNPIEQLWKHLKRRTTHNRSVPEFELVGVSVEAGLAHFQDHPAEVKRRLGTYLDHMARSRGRGLVSFSW